MSQILPLSSIIFLPFLTSIELHQEMTTSLTAVINRMSNHETYTDELFIIAYACPDWLTAPFLSIASIQTVQLLSSWNSESLKIAFTNTFVVLLCELWWILSSAVYYCNRECYCFIMNNMNVVQCSWILVQSYTWCLFSSVIVFMWQPFY